MCSVQLTYSPSTFGTLSSRGLRYPPNNRLFVLNFAMVKKEKEPFQGSRWRLSGVSTWTNKTNGPIVNPETSLMQTFLQN